MCWISSCTVSREVLTAWSSSSPCGSSSAGCKGAACSSACSCGSARTVSLTRAWRAERPRNPLPPSSSTSTSKSSGGSPSSAAPRPTASSTEGAITSRLVRLAGMAAPLSARPLDERGGPGQQAAPIHPPHGGGLHDGQQNADEEGQGQTAGHAVGEVP